MSPLPIGVLLLLVASGVFWALRRRAAKEDAETHGILHSDVAVMGAAWLLTVMFGIGALFVFAGLIGAAF